MDMNKSIRTTLTMDCDSDVWGWGIGHHFDVAEALELRGEAIPTTWQFKPSPLLNETDSRAESWALNDLLDSYDAGEITGDDLRQAGNVLARYCAWVKRAGRDY